MRFSFKYDGGGFGKDATVTLIVDGKQVAQERIPQAVMIRFSLDETSMSAKTRELQWWRTTQTK